MSFRDSQRFRKVYGYFRPLPRITDTSLTASQEYINDVVAGIDWKQSVRVTSTTNVNILIPSSIDAIVLSDEDRVLLKSQTAPEENGIYIYYNATGVLVRAKDAEQDTLTSGAAVYVEEGTDNKGTAWILSTPDPITVGTTSQTWVIFSTIYPVFIKSGSYARSTVNVAFGNKYTSQIGSDVFFYVSGTIGVSTNPLISVFGGDVFSSGSYTAAQGISGSLTKLANGSSYLIAGSNISVTSASNGAITIATTGDIGAAAGLNTHVQFNDSGILGSDSGFTYAKSSSRLFVSGALLIGSTTAAGSEKLRIVGDTRSEGTLTSVGNIMPSSDAEYSLGSSTQRWKHIHTGDLHLKNERGDWTIIEEENYLTIRNNSSGKRYKISMEPLPELNEELGKFSTGPIKQCKY